MSTVRIDEVGGIRSARRGIPALLIALAIAMLSIALWYLLTFSADYHGSYPKPEVPAGAEQAPAGGH